MLSKLIKYDIRSTWRDFAGVYLSILLGVLVLPPLFNVFHHPIINTVAGFIATAIVIATIVVTVVTLFKIFNTSVFSKAGYLTMTLPVTSSEIVISKLLVSTMWIILTGIVSVIGVTILIMNSGTVYLSDVADFFRKISVFVDSRGMFAFILLLTTTVASTVKEVAKLFLACSIAHLKQINRFRVLLGILSYFALSWLEAFIIQAIVFVAGNIPGVDESVRQLTLLNDMEGIQQFIGLVNGALAIGIVYALLLTAAYAVATVWILNRKLDLD
jgi:hypothetical protein